MTKTYWNGLPTRAIRGTAIVTEAPEFSHYWAKHLVGQRVAVVRVNFTRSQHGFENSTYLYDEDGSGWEKVTTGRGWPNVGHKSVMVIDNSFEAMM